MTNATPIGLSTELVTRTIYAVKTIATIVAKMVRARCRNFSFNLQFKSCHRIATRTHKRDGRDNKDERQFWMENTLM